MGKNLSSLPQSNDEYWDEAEKLVNQNIVMQDAKVCEHMFKGEGNLTQCQKCHWGFFLTSNTELKDGHVYLIDGRKLI